MSSGGNDSLVVKTATGEIRGSIQGQTIRWAGIPYAAAPVGSLRLRAPQPSAPWEGIRDASGFGNVAPQEPSKLIPIPTGISIDEDCLNLNVWGPAQPSEKPRPVMVWIHGGAYFIGFSSQPVYDGKSLVENGDVILVTVNYRLGALGFLDFSWLNDSTHTFDTNLGLRDIIAALTWVQENIAAFGGDPQNVTVFGESAGAGCITTLMTSPAAEGLFHRAIAQSSPATSVYGRARARGVAEAFLERAGISGVDVADRLMAADALELASHTTQLLNHVAITAPGTVAFAPVVDGDIVPDYPVQRFRDGKQHRIPLVIGTNKDEAALFKLMKSPLMPISEPAIKEMFDHVVQDNPKLAGDQDGILAAYPDFPKQKGAMEISRDAGFRMPSIWVAEAHSRVAPTWMYRFDQAPPLMKLLGIGASHAAELPYVFGTLPQKVNKKAMGFQLGGLSQAHKISERMQAHWLAFAQSSNPVATPLWPWPVYDELTRRTLIIDATETVVEDPEGNIRQAWGEQILGFK